jgi:acyl-coenzyme A synthetase/AMP-(fatty) acid ligase
MALEGGPLERPARVAELLQPGLDRDPDALALASLDRQLSWADLEQASRGLAASYLGLGLAPGDRVASLMPNRLELVIHYLACLRAGLVATPLNSRYATPQIDHALAVSGASLLLAHVERSEDLRASRRAGGLSLGVIWLGDSGADAAAFRELSAPRTQPVAPPSLEGGAPTGIFFTSGSTGPAKGVTHSRDSLGWMLASAAAAFELTHDDVFLPGSSISHLGSFMWTLSSFSVGATALVARSFDAHEILTLLRAYRPTVMAMIPAALTALVHDHDVSAEDFASLRICRAGSDKVALQLEREFEALAALPIDEGYGMTEVGLATLNPPSGRIKQGSIGSPVPGFSLSLRDEEGSEVAPGQVGRAWIRTKSHALGYWENPEASASLLQGDWLDSGDLMRCDDEGYLWFFGRKKQIIVHDGSNISPFEVEGALTEHPAVKLAGVVGVADEVHGENVRAYVELYEDQPRPTRQALIEFARERIGYRAPDEVVLLDDMPLNPTGKIDRVRLKQIAVDHLHPHGLGDASPPRP